MGVQKSWLLQTQRSKAKTILPRRTPFELASRYNRSMKYSSLVNRICPADNDGDPWEVHELACQRADNGEDILLLSIGQEADEVTPNTIVNSAVESLRAGDHHYTSVEGLPALRSSIARYHTALTNQTVSSENCIVYSGAQNALFAAAQVLLETGDEVIMSEPYYTTYAATFTASGALAVSVPVTKEHQYELQVNDIAAAINSNTQAIVVNSPNNPMGSCYTREQFSAIVKLCVKHGIWLILDAAYLDIVDVDKADLPHLCEGANELLVTVGSLSKSHRMTGWRIGWVVGPKAMVDHLAYLSMCMHYGLPPFVMKAAITALEQAQDTPIAVRNKLQRRRRIANPILSSMQGATLLDSGHGMFMLIDVSDLGISAREFCFYVLEQHNVSVLPCDGFGRAGRNLVRIGLCVDDQKLELACNRIVQSVAQLSM